TEKIARRGVRVPSEYAADYLDQLWVKDVASRDVITLNALDTLGVVRAWLETAVVGTQHHGFPVLDAGGRLLGVATRRQVSDRRHADSTRVGDLLEGAPAVAFADSSLREAADLMVVEGVGRLPVVTQAEPHKVIGILTRGDLLSAHARRLHEDRPMKRQPKSAV
ncbi:MAG: CBS domain-containing protein, partial [Polyangiaceae bacterium]